MITKKAKKSNTTTATKKAYDLNNIKTKKITEKQKGKGALNLMFSLVGFIGVTTLTLALFTPVLAKADTITTAGKGTFITEEFDCKVALADYAELQRLLDVTPRSDFKYSMFLGQFESVTEAMSNNDCEVK